MGRSERGGGRADVMADLEAAMNEARSLKKYIQEKKEEANDTSLEKMAEGIPNSGNTHLKPRKFLKGHFAKIYAMHWSEDKRNLVSASQDGKLIVWNAYTTNKLFAIPLRSSW